MRTINAEAGCVHRLCFWPHLDLIPWRGLKSDNDTSTDSIVYGPDIYKLGSVRTQPTDSVVYRPEIYRLRSVRTQTTDSVVYGLGPALVESISQTGLAPIVIRQLSQTHQTPYVTLPRESTVRQAVRAPSAARARPSSCPQN